MRRSLLILTAAAATLLAVLQATGNLPGSGKTTVRELAARRLPADRIAVEDGGTATTSRGILFRDVAAESGIDFVHDNALRGNYYLPEEMGPGVAFLDHDGDGDLDIYVAGGGAIAEDGPPQACHLYRNDGGRFTNVTTVSGAGVHGPAFGVAPADYDDDGDVDIFVNRLGNNALLRNRGDGTFDEVGAAAGVDDPGFGSSAAWVDYDHDGRLDLYVANYVDWSVPRATPCYTILGERDYCNPKVYEPAGDRMYRNLGGGRFADVTDETGIGSEIGNGLGVLAADLDDDGWVDLYVANDQTPAFFWRNDGKGGFRNDALVSGSAYNVLGVAIAGMGVACEDLDDDGDCDLVVTNIHDQTHLVLRNDGGMFEDISLETGMGHWSGPATTFGIALFDQDLDGDLDGFFANGEVNLDNRNPVGDNPYAQPDQFVRFDDGRFVDVTEGSGAAQSDVGRGVAAGDFDGDGDLDLLVGNNGGPLRLLRNENDSGHSWLIVDARTGPGRRAAVGARVSLTADGRTWSREVRPQQSYLSSSDPRVHFGLGSARRIDRLQVTWLDGTTTDGPSDLQVNRVVVIEKTPAHDAGDGT